MFILSTSGSSDTTMGKNTATAGEEDQSRDVPLPPDSGGVTTKSRDVYVPHFEHDTNTSNAAASNPDPEIAISASPGTTPSQAPTPLQQQQQQQSPDSLQVGGHGFADWRPDESPHEPQTYSQNTPNENDNNNTHSSQQQQHSTGNQGQHSSSGTGHGGVMDMLGSATANINKLNTNQRKWKRQWQMFRRALGLFGRNMKGCLKIIPGMGSRN